MNFESSLISVPVSCCLLLTSHHYRGCIQSRRYNSLSRVQVCWDSRTAAVIVAMLELGFVASTGSAERYYVLNISLAAFMNNDFRRHTGEQIRCEVTTGIVRLRPARSKAVHGQRER